MQKRKKKSQTATKQFQGLHLIQGLYPEYKKDRQLRKNKQVFSQETVSQWPKIWEKDAQPRATRVTQIKATLKYHYTNTRIAKDF